MLAELGMASWETIARRSQLMAEGRCSPAEYRKMVSEKLQAAQRTGLALAFGGGRVSPARLLGPWVRPAKANAKRLRRKG